MRHIPYLDLATYYIRNNVGRKYGTELDATNDDVRLGALLLIACELRRIRVFVDPEERETRKLHRQLDKERNERREIVSDVIVWLRRRLPACPHGKAYDRALIRTVRRAYGYGMWHECLKPLCRKPWDQWTPEDAIQLVGIGPAKSKVFDRAGKND